MKNIKDPIIIIKYKITIKIHQKSVYDLDTELDDIDYLLLIYELSLLFLLLRDVLLSTDLLLDGLTNFFFK